MAAAGSSATVAVSCTHR
ncbi:hypothetical protein [Mycobacterium sp.]